MFPELFEIPFIHLTVKSYGLMMVIGFLSAIALIRHLSRNIIPNPQLITNASLYSLIAGVAGARLFYVVHHFDEFQSRDWLYIFAIWHGGLELLGGVVLATTVIFFYLLHHKLPIRRCLDILAIGLMLALVFGRIGCFLNGCCFGKPTDKLWGVRFPYGSFAYSSQVQPNPHRDRPKPYLELPVEFFNYSYDGTASAKFLKSYEQLTRQQKDKVTNGEYRCLPVHPTQLYSSVTATFLTLVLYFFWRRRQNARSPKNAARLFSKPGCTFALMFILYGTARFFIEFLRDDNPFEFDSLTVSQNISIAMIVLGAVLMAIFQKMPPKALKS